MRRWTKNWISQLMLFKHSGKGQVRTLKDHWQEQTALQSHKNDKADLQHFIFLMRLLIVMMNPIKKSLSRLQDVPSGINKVYLNWIVLNLLAGYRIRNARNNWEWRRGLVQMSLNSYYRVILKVCLIRICTIFPAKLCWKVANKQDLCLSGKSTVCLLKKQQKQNRKSNKGKIYYIKQR